MSVKQRPAAATATMAFKTLFHSLMIALCVRESLCSTLYARRSSALEDQATAATGFIYHTDSNGPTSYMQFNSGTGNLDKFAHPPITLTQFQPAPLPYLTQVYHPAPVLQEAEPVKQEEFKEFSEGEGNKYNNEHRSAAGEKGSEGYEKSDGYEKASKGEHEKEGQEGHYSVEGGNKEGKHDEAEQYSSKHESGKSYEGGSSGEESSHKKGSKTTGFHKVYHKDEYKKDHTFYDESDVKGYNDKYGNSHSEHSSKAGGHKEGGSQKSSHSGNDFGKKGHYDKGHYDKKDSGHKAEQGKGEYYNNQSDYKTKGGEEDNKSYGYEEESKN